MYCRKCSYDIRGLSDHACPECGTAFDPHNPKTYRRRPKSSRTLVVAAVLIGGMFFLCCAFGLLWSSSGTIVVQGTPAGTMPPPRAPSGPADLVPSPIRPASPNVIVLRGEPPTTDARNRSPHPLVAAARKQIGVTVTYDPAYVGLEYPGGDVPIDRGVCTDVVIRALRDAHAIDLQQALHEDMKANFSKYPTTWGLSKPDRNIDHRRVPNLMTYFDRQDWELPITGSAPDYLPGDIVTCTVGGNRPHIMIVSTIDGVDRWVIHNIGRGTREEDRLFEFPITGHYRVPAKVTGAGASSNAAPD